MNPRLVLVGLVIAMFVATYFISEHRNSRVTEAIRESETGVPTFRESEFKATLGKMRPLWSEAAAQWRARRAQASFDAYHNIKGTMSVYLQHYPDKEVEPKLTVKQWLEQEETAYRDAVAKDLTWLFDGLANGDFTPEEVKRAVSGFAYDGLKEPEAQFKAEGPRIEQARVKAARKWVRVTVSLNNSAYEVPVMKEIRDKWAGRGGFKLVFSYPLTPLENEATAKTLDFHVDQHDTVYESPKGLTTTVQRSISIPDAVRLTFKVQGASRVPTSWDQLSPVSASVKLPDSVSVWGKGGVTTESTDKLIKEKQAELIATLTAKLKAELPKFEIFPGVDVTKLSVIQANRLDRAACATMAFLDPERLRGELMKLTETADPLLSQDLAFMAVSLDIDSLAPWLIRKAPALAKEAQIEVARELRTRPWFGDYEVLAGLIGNSTYFPEDALRACEGHFESKVRETVIKKINDPATQDRVNYLTFYLHQAPMDDVMRNAAGWAKDRNSNFAVSAYIGILNREQKRAFDLMFEVFDQVTPEVQSQMLRFFKYSPQEHGSKGLDLLVKVARLKNDASPSARDVIRQASQISAAGWEAYLTLAREETDPKAKERMERDLIVHARQAKSGKSPAFIQEKFKGTDPVLREAAIQVLIETDEVKDELLHDLAKMVADNPDDKALLQTVIFGIRQYHSIRKNWDFSEKGTDLKTLLQLGTHSPEPNVRQACYQVMVFAIKRGFKEYESMLNSAMAVEKEPRLKRGF